MVEWTDTIPLQYDSVDALVRAWEGDHCFSARTAYRALFGGHVAAAGADQIWRSHTPMTCRMLRPYDISTLDACSLARFDMPSGKTGSRTLDAHT